MAEHDEAQARWSMPVRLFVRVTLVAGLIALPQSVKAQPPLTSSGGAPQRAARVKSLVGEIVIQRDGDFERITPEYAENHIAEIRSIVQEEVLEALNRSDQPGDVENALKTVLGGTVPSSVYFADLKGVKTAVAAFYVTWGGALTEMRGFLLGYRKTGPGYVAAAVESIMDCTLTLEPLDSPRSNEMWFVANAPIRYFFTGAPLRIVLYSFDGYEFKELWTGGGINGELHIGKSEFTVDYWILPQACGNPAFCEDVRIFRDTVKLTSGGPVVSKQELSQK